MLFKPTLFLFKEPLQLFLWQGIIQAESDKNIFAILVPMGEMRAPFEVFKIAFVEKQITIAIYILAKDITYIFYVPFLHIDEF